jgi:hypothetical protein
MIPLDPYTSPGRPMMTSSSTQTTQETACHTYWTILRLSTTGQATPRVLPQVQQFFETQFPDIVTIDASADRQIQSHLLNLRRSAASQTDRDLAELSLRCYISRQILSVCRRLVAQFGTNYHFNLADILPYVLEDDGRTQRGTAEPLGLKILHSFQSERAGLSNWTMRLTRSQPDLVKFLLEKGLYMVSDWAILNDTNSGALERILLNFYQLSSLEAKQADQILRAYRLVYLPDRASQSSHTACQPPTNHQLQRMNEVLHLEGLATLSSQAIMGQLHYVANLIRQYRIYRRGGPLPAQLVKASTIGMEDEPFDIPATRVDPEAQLEQEFLENYTVIFQAVFDQSLIAALQTHQQKLRSPEKRQQFQAALNLFYIQQMSMGAIAQSLGMRAQDAVVRLLRLKDLRALVAQQMEMQIQKVALRAQVERLIRKIEDCDGGGDATVDRLWHKHVEMLLQADEQGSKAPSKLRAQSFFNQRLSVCINAIAPTYKGSSKL